jgi:hypothetical protein
MSALRRIRIVGVHPVESNEILVNETVAIRWGYDLRGEKLERAKRDVRNEFKCLFLIEIEIDPPDARFDSCEITQPASGRAVSDWQVPYDERPIDQKSGRWAFFFHFLNLGRPLRTPVGDLQLPSVTTRSSYLSNVDYDSP